MTKVLVIDTSIHTLANDFPKGASQHRSMGDMTITKVADFYARSGFIVSIFTADEQLKAYEPLSNIQPLQPRRRTPRNR